VIALLYIPFAIFRAWLDAKRIKDGKRIYHGVNGAITLACAGLVFWLADWKAALALLFITRVFFDTALNYFRGLPLDYVSLNPKSIVDRLEKKVFGLNGWTPKIIYLFIIVSLLI